jgi:hypothetical protein
MLSNRFIPRLIALALCSTVALVFSAFASGAVTHAATCSVHEIGPDTSLGTGDAPVIHRSYGETFTATDTLVESITVWRASADDRNFEGWELFIVGTDWLGQPNVANILLQGKVVTDPYGAGLAPMTFSFDPPFALPAPGKYEFAVQQIPCDVLGYLLVSLKDVYPEGDLWSHYAYPPCGGLFPGPAEGPNYDLIFNIVFCDEPVATKAETWGRVKASYR